MLASAQRGAGPIPEVYMFQKLLMHERLAVSPGQQTQMHDNEECYEADILWFCRVCELNHDSADYCLVVHVHKVAPLSAAYCALHL